MYEKNGKTHQKEWVKRVSFVPLSHFVRYSTNPPQIPVPSAPGSPERHPVA